MRIMALELPRVGKCPSCSEASAVQKSMEADIIFLFETRMDEKRMLVLSKKLGIEHMKVVDCRKRGE